MPTEAPLLKLFAHKPVVDELFSKLLRPKTDCHVDAKKPTNLAATCTKLHEVAAPTVFRHVRLWVSHEKVSHPVHLWSTVAQENISHIVMWSDPYPKQSPLRRSMLELAPNLQHLQIREMNLSESYWSTHFPVHLRSTYTSLTQITLERCSSPYLFISSFPTVKSIKLIACDEWGRKPPVGAVCPGVEKLWICAWPEGTDIIASKVFPNLKELRYSDSSEFQIDTQCLQVLSDHKNVESIVITLGSRYENLISSMILDWGEYAQTIKGRILGMLDPKAIPHPKKHKWSTLSNERFAPYSPNLKKVFWLQQISVHDRRYFDVKFKKMLALLIIVEKDTAGNISCAVEYRTIDRLPPDPYGGNDQDFSPYMSREEFFESRFQDKTEKEIRQHLQGTNVVSAAHVQKAWDTYIKKLDKEDDGELATRERGGHDFSDWFSFR